MNDMLPDLGQLRLDDVLKFLDVCRFADGQPPEHGVVFGNFALRLDPTPPRFSN